MDSDWRNARRLRHPDEFSYGRDAGFLHHATAMDLDRLLRSTKIVSDLFVEQPGNDALHDFELTRGQRVEPRARRRSF